MMGNHQTIQLASEHVQGPKIIMPLSIIYYYGTSNEPEPCNDQQNVYTHESPSNLHQADWTLPMSKTQVKHGKTSQAACPEQLTSRGQEKEEKCKRRNGEGAEFRGGGWNTDTDNFCSHLGAGVKTLDVEFKMFFKIFRNQWQQNCSHSLIWWSGLSTSFILNNVWLQLVQTASQSWHCTSRRIEYSSK